MIDIRENGSSKPLEIKITDTITKSDMNHLLRKMESYISETADPRLLLIMEEFGGWDSMSVFLDELKMETDYLAKFNRIALAGDQPWEKWMTEIRNTITAHEMKFFNIAAIPRARKWLEQQAPH